MATEASRHYRAMRGRVTERGPRRAPPGASRARRVNLMTVEWRDEKQDRFQCSGFSLSFLTPDTRNLTPEPRTDTRNVMKKCWWQEKCFHSWRSTKLSVKLGFEGTERCR
jgi:hypothetical protein